MIILIIYSKVTNLNYHNYWHCISYALISFGGNTGRFYIILAFDPSYVWFDIILTAWLESFTALDVNFFTIKIVAMMIDTDPAVAPTIVPILEG